MKRKPAVKKNNPGKRNGDIHNHYFPVVAIGASAGGIEAISELLKNLPPDTGMAFVYIQHLDPTHESMLTAILSKATKMKVVEAKNMSRILPNHVYVIPPNKDIVAVDGVLKLTPRPLKPAMHMPIDGFFNSLAEKNGERAIGVVLSGNASDGTLGLKSIKIAGGLTFAQDDSAKFQSMPKSAVAEGVVDLVLSPKGIAAELERLSEQKDIFQTVMSNPEEATVETSDEELTNILTLLRKSTDVDFSHYKKNTIRRRVIRRMLLHRLRTMKEYARYLKQHAGEANTLYQDLLINVTNFFRDTSAMEYLKKSVLPRILRTKTSNDPVRIWIPACSTGEEAYSLAILLIEILGEKATNTAIQIFATDLSETAIAKARLGIYSKSELTEVSPRRLQRFFTTADNSYRIVKSIRDLCVFAPHNIFKDPPFSRLDLISCCNLLIYLDTVLQKKTIATFHYSLNPNGFLVLGKSETIGAAANLFTPLDKRVRIYSRKKDASPKALMDMTYRLPEMEKHYKAKTARGETHKETGATADLEKMVDTILLNRFVPASVVVNQDLDILQFRGSTGLFLEPAPGRASLNLLKMARAGLGFEIRSAVHKVIKSGEAFKKTGIEISDHKNPRRINIEIIPMKSDGDEKNYLIVFGETPAPVLNGDSSAVSKDRRVKQLEQELSGAREDMRSMIEEQEAINEELQSANEEILSSNEELQSINEELETSKEEVESSNEELMTINQELQVRNEQLTESYEYSEAMFATIREAALILDENLKVRKANRMFYKIFHVREEDIEGKSVYEINNRQLDLPEMHEVLDSIIPRESKLNGFEIRNKFADIGEKVMLLNARRISQNKDRQQLTMLAIEDITEHEIGKRIIADREAWFRNMADNAPALIWMSDLEGHRTFFNKTWLDFTGKPVEQELGMGWKKDLHKDDVERFVKIYNESFKKRKPFNIDYRLRNKDGEYRWIVSRGKPAYDSDGNFTGFIGTCTEIHDERMRKAELEKSVGDRTLELQNSNIRLQSANRELQQFAFVASHDLQEPLRKIITFSDILMKGAGTHLSDDENNYIRKIADASYRMRKLIEDMLNFSRLEAAATKAVKTNLNDIIKEVLKDYDEAIRESNAKIKTGKLPDVSAVPFQMEQLFSNLLSNALKFKYDDIAPIIGITSRKLASINLRKYPNLNKRRDYCEIIVKDNGIGFNQKYARQIFDIFQRLHNREKYAGTGIGLALCLKIVESHGGEIFAQSKEGKGTAIHVILPMRGGGVKIK